MDAHRPTFAPIAFIPPRAGYAFYFPLAGWAIYLAQFLWISISAALPGESKKPATQLVLLLVAVFLLVRAHRVPRTWILSPAHIAHPGIGRQRLLRTIIDAIEPLQSALPRKARLLFVDDPFPPDYYTLTHLCQLLYRDPALTVHRGKLGPATAGYDGILKFEGQQLRQVSVFGE